MSEENQSVSPAEKLYAGKFKTIEELETGYKNSFGVYNENQQLKSQMEQLTKVPDDYLIPAEIKISDNEIVEVKRIAKNSGLNQQHFERLLKETEQYGQSKQKQFEDIRKSLGEETLNIIQDYVKNHYPEKLQSNILNNLIIDKEARDAALSHRQQLLSSAAPGMRTIATGNYRITQDDVLKAREAIDKNRGKARVEAQQKYINLLQQRSSQKE